MKNDAFEAKYMHDGTRVLHRDKRVSRKMALLLAVPGLFILFQAISVPLFNDASTRPMPRSIVPFWTIGMGLLAVIFFLLAILFGVLRFVVTERAIHVKYGLWGPTIPLESVISCRVVDYDWTKYGGWGIRRGADGSWAYVPSSGSVVEIVYRDGVKEKTVVLGAADPHALARSIVETASRSAARMRVDVEASEPEPQHEDELLEQDEEREVAALARHLDRNGPGPRA
ncbi:MAG: hypothetical protein BGO98_32900 [Myxococcales bacterium 68-20]|nr:hypothetical protein [Myxococcales bacterium]OJY18534.1 MAG: hypothetical protein BGO98_32900 [Myxococcales bacterium 68-20]